MRPLGGWQLNLVSFQTHLIYPVKNWEERQQLTIKLKILVHVSIAMAEASEK